MSGRSEYRDNAILRCPACSAVMIEQAITEAVIDVCDECGGVWADPEDGDIATVATQAHVPELDEEAARSLPSTCPRCAGAMVPWTAGGVTLGRCGACSGTFVPRNALDTAMWLPPDAGAPPLSAMEGLVRWVRRILGRD